MNRCLSIALVLTLGGCAAGAAEVQRSSTTPEAAASAAREAEAQRAQQTLAREQVRELSAQLALAQAENEELRDEVDVLRTAEQRRVTRIAESCAPSADATVPEPSTSEPAPEPERTAAGPRPVLRLYGPEASSRPAMNTRGVTAIPGPEAPLVVAPPPQGAARLPVFATGSDREAVPAIPLAPVAVAGEPPMQAPAAELVTPGGHERAVRQYRRALRSLSERRLNDASEGLDAFVREHPSHPYADNAMYWRAEILFTRHDYRQALAAFSGLIERYPRGNKVPDALLRIGLCYERMGRRGRARRVFERLRAQYPQSLAARMARREDA